MPTASSAHGGPRGRPASRDRLAKKRRILITEGSRTDHLMPLQSLYLHVSCLDLTSIGSGLQRCSCEPKHEKRTEDCPNGFHLCFLCGITLAGGYSRWSWEVCERCDTAVTKKKLNQWYFKITDYADRLLDDMAQLEGKWPDKVLTMQRNWIGRSTGANVDFVIEGREKPITIYTTRPDTLFGATFMVVAVDSELAAELVVGTGV